MLLLVGCRVKVWGLGLGSGYIHLFWRFVVSLPFKRRYVLPDPDAKKPFRMMKAVKDEGMPTYKNPFVHGNLGLVKSGYG